MGFAAPQSSPSYWCCPVCSFRVNCDEGLAPLLEHALTVSNKRVDHQRFLMLIGELLIHDPPPSTMQRKGGRQIGAATSWDHGPSLTRLFGALRSPQDADRNRVYKQLEEEHLGVQDEDIFGGGP